MDQQTIEDSPPLGDLVPAWRRAPRSLRFGQRQSSGCVAQRHILETRRDPVDGRCAGHDANGDSSVKTVTFPEGKTETLIEGRIKGRGYVDHTPRASAGQALNLQLQANHRAIYFNLLPDDGVYTETRECEAEVVRRSFDGTATVELRWDKTWKRRILFVKGEPKAADVPQLMTFTRNERGWVVSFGNDESFEIPEPLVFGG